VTVIAVIVTTLVVVAVTVVPPSAMLVGGSMGAIVSRIVTVVTDAVGVPTVRRRAIAHSTRPREPTLINGTLFFRRIQTIIHNIPHPDY